MKIIDNIHLISSTLKTVASENTVTAEELEQQDKPLEEVLNAKTKKPKKQSEETTEQSQ
jgi:hypothetical protein